MSKRPGPIATILTTGALAATLADTPAAQQQRPSGRTADQQQQGQTTRQAPVDPQQPNVQLGPDGLPTDPALRAIAEAMIKQATGGQDNALHAALREGDTNTALNIVSRLNPENPRDLAFINSPGTEGQMPLYMLMSQSNADQTLLETMIAKGANPNGLSASNRRSNPQGAPLLETALHLVTYEGRPRGIEALLRYKADARVLDGMGQRASSLTTDTRQQTLLLAAERSADATGRPVGERVDNSPALQPAPGRGRGGPDRGGPGRGAPNQR